MASQLAERIEKRQSRRVREATLEDWDVLWPLYMTCLSDNDVEPNEDYSRRVFMAALRHGHKAFMTDRGFMHVEDTPWAHAPGRTLLIHHAGGEDLVEIGTCALAYAEEVGASIVSFRGCINHGPWLEDLGFTAYAPVWRKSI